MKTVSTYADGVGVWLSHLEGSDSLLKNIRATKLLVHGYTHRPESQTKERLTIIKSLDGIFSDAPDTLETK